MKGYLKNLFFYAAILIVVVLLLYFVFGTGTEKPLYYELVTYFRNIGTDEEAVERFELDSKNKLTVRTTGGKKFSVILQDRDRFYKDCYVYVTEYNELAAEEGSKLKPLKYDLKEPTVIPAWVAIIPYLAIGALIVFVFIYAFREASGGKGSKINNFGRARAKVASPDNKNKIYFSDVAGADEEKEELREIVDFLKDPIKFTKLGAKIPHGVLLMGPPGTGKTLLAKAVAGEAGVPFFSISGSDFVEMYVGVGASRVRDLFETARKHPASIIFIDEIDAVGRHRGAGLGGGHDEREQTLNQLLVEMDGFGGTEGVIVIAATNRPDILDPALLRPGRFDRQVTVNYPDIKGREEILHVHARNKPFEGTVDFHRIAQTTVGFTGADLANLLNEAALLAARRGKSLIGMDEIEDSYMKAIVGPKKKTKIRDEKDNRLTAIHEAGHAVAAYFCPTADPVKHVTIIPAGRTGGVTVMIPEKDTSYKTKTQMFEDIVVDLGGRIAEQLNLDDISTGASMDIQQATNVARSMVMNYGMSDRLGTILYGSGSRDVFLGRDISSGRDFSEATAAEIDAEVRAIVDKAYARCTQILTEHADKLLKLADYLLHAETIDGDQFKVLMEGDASFEELDQMAESRRRKSREENDEKDRLNKLEEERRAEEERRKAEEEARRREEERKNDDDQKPPHESIFPGFDDQ